MKRIAGILSIIFLSSLITGCFLYEVRDYNNPYDPELTGGAIPIPYAAIQLDGDTSEWYGINTFIQDQTYEGTVSGQPTIPGGDIEQFKIAQDDENLYFYLSTANGYPLENEEINFNLDFRDIDDNYSLNLVSLNHNINNCFDLMSNYNYRIDQTNWGGYSITSSIRFTGVNPAQNGIELGISKNDYWNIIGTNTRLNISLSTRYQPYEALYGMGELDNIWDLERDFQVMLKSVNESYPSTDVPILRFSQGTPNVNGLDDGSTEWTDTGFWYQDFQGDDTGGKDNCDIDKVYIKQDNDRVYLLLTFFDSAAFPALNTYYYIDVETWDYQYQHTFYAENLSNTWGNVWVDYLGSQYINGSSAADGPGFGVELEFEKHPAWSDIPVGPMRFTIRVQDNGSADVDRVIFYGSYKANSDPLPQVF